MKFLSVVLCALFVPLYGAQKQLSKYGADKAQALSNIYMIYFHFKALDQNQTVQRILIGLRQPVSQRELDIYLIMNSIAPLIYKKLGQKMVKFCFEDNLDHHKKLFNNDPFKPDEKFPCVRLFGYEVDSWS